MSIPFTWVYLIHDPFTGLYKIGRSDNPEERCEQLRNARAYGTVPAAPTEYQLLEAWLCPEKTESRLHNNFQGHRVRGEWFDLAAAYALDDDIEPLTSEDVLRITQEACDLHMYRRLYSPASLDTETCVSFARANATLRSLVANLRQQVAAARLMGFDPVQLLPPAPPDVAVIEQEQVF